MDESQVGEKKRLSGKCPRVLVVERDPAAARKHARLLKVCDCVVDAVPSVADAPAAIATPPHHDLVLLGLRVGDAAAERVLDAACATPARVLVVGARLDTDRSFALQRRGVSVVHEPATDAALLAAAQRLLSLPDTVGAFACAHLLSPRETAVLRLAVHEYTPKEAAAIFGCAVSTVWNHWHRIKAKTGCRSQSEVIARLHHETVERLQSAGLGAKERLGGTS